MSTSTLEKFFNAVPTALYTGFGFKLDSLPPTPVDCVSISLLAPGTSTKYFGQTESITTQIIEMVVRSATYASGLDVSESIRQYFEKFYNDDLFQVVTVGGVANQGKDLQGKRRHLQHFEVKVKE